MAASNYKLLRSKANNRNKSAIKTKYRCIIIKKSKAGKNKKVQVVFIGCKADGTTKKQLYKKKSAYNNSHSLYRFRGVKLIN